MPTMAICPNCRVLLTPDANSAENSVCEKCHGQFLRCTDPDAALVQPMPEDLTPSELSCPECLTAMMSDSTVNHPQIRCPACFGVWTDFQSAPASLAAIAVTEEAAPLVDEQESKFVKSLLFGISLPERVLRTAVGVTAGTAREAAALMVPQAFQSSKSYEVAIRNSLNFLTDTVGGFESKDQPADDAGEHLAKKAIGNFVDMAGLATLHVSPMWILAAVSDIAYGSSTYVKELAKELEKQGIIDSTSTIHNVDDILDAIQNTSGGMASSFDKPPLSVDELRSFVKETRESAGKADLRTVMPEAELRAYWESLQQTAKKENITLFEAATAVTMHTAQQASNITLGAVTGVKVAGSLLHRNVFMHYQDSLSKLRTEGFLNVVQSTYLPYTTQVYNNFSTERKSWTETLLDPKNVFGFFQRKQPET